MDLYLASSSPRRRELLAQLGLRPGIVVADTDETPAPDETPAAYVTRIAQAKARAGWATLTEPVRRPLLAADTAVVVDDHILGKPVDAERALQMLALLSGQSHVVLTAVSVLSATAGSGQRHEPGACATSGQALRERQVLVRTEVSMRPITRNEALAYWASGEPRDKAGAYAVQGRGAIFVEAISGSYSNVVGLPLFETARLLREHGIDPLAG
ncbi:septum formation protein Maf [Halochromatium salexigens]|uniref:dTTP/UTP pyrophosphatase n=1 Tax=Halochromatium salexigens TaxID=49447 RepID=A0AAJ0XF32_HALSE|nr:septum formation protein Maf [Halochromatium salexigens]